MFSLSLLATLKKVSKFLFGFALWFDLGEVSQSDMEKGGNPNSGHLMILRHLSEASYTLKEINKNNKN